MPFMEKKNSIAWWNKITLLIWYVNMIYMYFNPYHYLKVSHHTEIICGNGVLSKISHTQIEVWVNFSVC